jgi:hypothetical protein
LAVSGGGIGTSLIALSLRSPPILADQRWTSDTSRSIDTSLTGTRVSSSLSNHEHPANMSMAVSAAIVRARSGETGIVTLLACS